LNAVDLYGVCRLRHGRTVSSPVVTFLYRQFNIQQFYVLRSISEQTAIISLCNIN